MAKRSWVIAWIKTGIQKLGISVMYGSEHISRQLNGSWYMTHSLWVIDFWTLTSLFRLWTFSSKLFKQESCRSNKTWTLSIFLSTPFCISILSLKKLFILLFLNVVQHFEPSGDFRTKKVCLVGFLTCDWNINLRNMIWDELSRNWSSSWPENLKKMD